MRYYEVIDMQGAGFMSYTRTENWTKRDIHEHLLSQYNDQNDDDQLGDDTTLDELLDIFELNIEQRGAE